ncbi:MAG: phosphoenolpyruvate kinase [Byssovorax sp.]
MNSSSLSLAPEIVSEACAPIAAASAAFALRYPGESGARRPVHTVYGGAHLFRADLAQKLGAAALAAIEAYAPNAMTFSLALGLPGSASLLAPPSPIASFNAAFSDDAHATRGPLWLAETVHARVLEKLRREPVEDLRIDFEDGYGTRSDAEEDDHAVAAARAVGEGMNRGTLPPFLGIRIKGLGGETRSRAARTLDLFLTALASTHRGLLPGGFVITLPKITVAEEVAALASLLDALEGRLGLAHGAIGIELMIEAPQIVLGPSGVSGLPRLLDAGRGRVVSAHFGAYDYTAACDVVAQHQTLAHPACDLARQMMQLCFAGTSVRLSDGATNVLPIPPHKASPGAHLGPREATRNHETVIAAWKLHHDSIRRALIQGIYQGWDLHPAQLPVRYAATYAFFLEGLEVAESRLVNFVNRAAQATRTGPVFDDAATGQGLLNFFLRAVDAGALTEVEAATRTRLSLAELRGKSFARIVAERRAP